MSESYQFSEASSGSGSVCVVAGVDLGGGEMKQEQKLTVGHAI